MIPTWWGSFLRLVICFLAVRWGLNLWQTVVIVTGTAVVSIFESLAKEDTS